MIVEVKEPMNIYQQFLSRHPNKFSFQVFDDGSFSTSINANQLIRNKVGKSKNTKKLMQKITLDKGQFGKFFAFVIKGDEDHAVHAQSGYACKQGFRGYYDTNVNGEKITCFLLFRKNAYIAAQIFGLTKVAMEKEQERDYPSWVSKCISDRETKVGDKKIWHYGIVLVTNLFKKKTFFAYMDLDDTKRRLMIPVDENNSNIPWQDFYFK